MPSIQKRPNGSWRARYEDPRTGRERSMHFPTKQAAVDFLADQRVRMRDGTWIDPAAGRRTFRDYAVGWLEAQVHLRDSSVSQKRNILDLHLLPAFGDELLVRIQRSAIQAWVTKQGQSLSASYVESHYVLLRQILKAAVEDHALGSSPCWKINLPAEDKGRVRIPTTGEVAAVLASAPAHAQALIELGASTGVRISEACGLTVDRIDFLRRTVTIDRQLVGITRTGQPRFGPPKTKASHRTIPVPESLTETLAGHLSRWPSTDLLFHNAHSRPWSRGSLSDEWRRWRGTKGWMTWRDLRHYYASALIHALQSVKVVQERLGHASASTTWDTYAHLWPSDDDTTRTVVEGLSSELRRTADGLVAQRSRSQA